MVFTTITIDCYREICGLPLNTYFSAVKMRWLLDHVEKVREAQTAGNLVLGTIDTWLIYVSSFPIQMLMLILETQWPQTYLDRF